MTANPPLPVLLRRRDEDRLRAYRDNLDFYAGNQWPGRARRGERRLTFNYARALVEKVTSYLLNGQSVQVEARDGDTPAGRDRARAAERRLREVESRNALAQLDFETELDCAVLGDACYKVTWDGEPRITAPDVQGVFAWRQADDPARVTAIASQYSLETNAMTAAATGGPLPATTVTEYWTPDTFELWRGDELAERLANPYGFIPFVLFPNQREPRCSGWPIS